MPTMGNSWRLIMGPSRPIESLDRELWAATNMAIDEAISIAHQRGFVPPTFRIYTWPFQAITVGYFQSVQNEIDLDACRRSSIPVIRRWTGGRAVFHGTDLSYSLVASSPSSAFPVNTIREVFSKTGRAFVLAFNQIGITTKIQGARTLGSKNPVCFASPSQHEITNSGRKIIGSAQRRWAHGFLQQGSIPLNYSAHDIVPFLKVREQEDRHHLIQTLAASATGLYDISGESLSIERVQEAIKYGIETGFKIMLDRSDLSLFELQLADDLMKNKYGQLRWNIHKEWGERLTTS